MQNCSRGRLIAGFAIGAACGLMLPLLLMFSMWFLPFPIIFAFLWVWAGWPAAAFSVATVAATGYWFFGGGFAAGLVLISLPGILAAAMTSRRKPFFRAVGESVALQWAALFLLTVAAWLIFRQNLVDVMTGSLRTMFEDLPLIMQRYMLSMLGQAGAFGANTGINFASGLMTNAQAKDLIEQFFYTVNAGLKLSLPAYVIASGATTGALAYALPAWVRVRRGDEPAVPFVKPGGWRLSANLVIGPPALTLACFLLDRSGVSGADAAYLAMMNLTWLLFTVQALGAIDRRMKAAGVSAGKRAAISIMAVVIGQQLMPFVGVYSALFGSEGLISKQIRKRMDGKGDE